MKKYFNIFLSVFALVLISCSANQLENEDLSNSSKEDYLMLRQTDSTFAYAELHSSRNPFNNLGQSYYRLLTDLKSAVLAGNIRNQMELNSYLSSQNVNQYSSSLSADQERQLQVFFENSFEYGSSMPDLIAFENQLAADVNLNSALLKKLAILKYGIFFSSYFSDGIAQPNFKASNTCWRRTDCLDRCICNKAYNLFHRSNWVEQAFFMASAGESFAIWVASCGWDCLTN